MITVDMVPLAFHVRNLGVGERRRTMLMLGEGAMTMSAYPITRRRSLCHVACRRLAVNGHVCEVVRHKPPISLFS